MDSEALVGEAVSLDSLFDALGQEHRMRVLRCLYQAGPDVTYRAADLVADDEDPGVVVPALYHVHFPKLADLELVEWDREANAVERGPAFHAVDRVFDRLDDRDGLPPGEPIDRR